MIFDMSQEREQVLKAIYEGIKALANASSPEMMQNHEKVLPPDFTMPYFVLSGLDSEGKTVTVTPTNVFTVITCSKQRNEYCILATRALMMQRIVAFMAHKFDVGPYKVFLDPTRAILMMAGIAFQRNNLDFTGRPLGFEMCFPFGRSLLVRYSYEGGEGTLKAQLAEPDVFLTYPLATDQFNSRQSKLFSKMRAYAERADNKPLEVTLNTFKIQES